MQCDNREPEFVTAFQDQHDHIAMSYPQRLEIGSRLIGVFLQICKCEINMFAPVVCPAQSFFVGFFSGPCIYYIISEIKVLGYFYLEILYKIFLRRKRRLI